MPERDEDGDAEAVQHVQRRNGGGIRTVQRV